MSTPAQTPRIDHKTDEKESPLQVPSGLKPIPMSEVPDQCKPFIFLMEKMMKQITELENHIKWLPKEKPDCKLLDEAFAGRLNSPMIDMMLTTYTSKPKPSAPSAAALPSPPFDS